MQTGLGRSSMRTFSELSGAIWSEQSTAIYSISYKDTLALWEHLTGTGMILNLACGRAGMESKSATRVYAEIMTTLP